MTQSQLAARDIETARRWYVASIGTPYEARVRERFYRLVVQIREQQGAK